jgi:hypothetical protein
MLSDIVNFLKSAKSCVDTIISELEEFKKLEANGMKKIDLFIEIIKELGCSVQNLEKAFASNTEIPIEHRLKYLIIKELKFDLDDFIESISEYKQWFQAINMKPSEPEKVKSRFHFCCSCSSCPCKLFQVSEPAPISNLINAGIQLALIPPSQMNKQLDDSFQKIMEKVRIVIELEKDIFGTAIKIFHPILQKAWMSFGPIDKAKIEVEEHMLVEALVNRLKDECGGIVVNESKCRNILGDFLQDLERKAGNKPNGKISIDELNEFLPTEENSKCVLDMLGLQEQPGCHITSDLNTSFIETSQIITKSDDVLRVLAKYVSEHIEKKSNLPIPPKSPSPLNLPTPPSPLNQPTSPSPLNQPTSPDKSNQSIKTTEKKLDLNLNLPLIVTSSDKDGILECEGYGSNWPYKVICEFEVPNLELTNSITATFIATDQGWGGTGHDNVRYRVGSNKISPAFFIDRDKNPSNTYTYTIKKDELNGLVDNNKITFWLCSAPWGGWSAHLTSCEVVVTLI